MRYNKEKILFELGLHRSVSNFDPNPIGVKQKLKHWIAFWFGGVYEEKEKNGYWRYYPTILIRIKLAYFKLSIFLINITPASIIWYFYIKANTKNKTK